MTTEKIYVGIFETEEYESKKGTKVKKKKTYAFSTLEEAIENIPHKETDEENPVQIAGENSWTWIIWSVSDEERPNPSGGTIRSIAAYERATYSIFETELERF